MLKSLTENVVIYGVERSRQIKKSYDSYIAIVQSMQNVIHHIEQGSFSTVPWPIGWLGSREEVVSVEVCWELWEDDFFSDFWQKRKIGDGPVVFQTVWVKRWLFQKWFYNGLFKNRERHQCAETDWWRLSLQEAVAPSIQQRGTWEAGLVNMSSGRIAKSCFLRTALTQVQKSARKIGCTGHLLVVLAQAFDCLAHRGLFSLSGWNSQQMRQEGRKQEGQLVETSQSYNHEVRYKHWTALCNNYSVLSEKRSNRT